MKILTIRLKNLASVEDEVIIDFTQEPLASAGIYAISGQTGAGKSTILDALCLALYDRAPRFADNSENLLVQDVGDGQIRQNDVRNVLRRGAGEGFAEVEFVAVDQHRYRARWEVARARGKANGTLKQQALSVVDLNTGEELQGRKKEILEQLVRLTGLTYEQFTRTVLLAQNDFATFLKSKEEAKAELLEKLTGTEIYSRISQTVFQLSKNANIELNRLLDSKKLVEVMPEEEAGQLAAQHHQLDGRRQEAVKQLAGLNEKLKTLNAIKARRQELELKHRQEIELVERLTALQKEKQQQEEQLSTFRKQCEAMQPELRKARELDAQLRTLDINRRQAEEIYGAARRRKDEAAQQLARTVAALDAELPKLNPTNDPAIAGLKPEEQLEQATRHITLREQQLAVAQRENDERQASLNGFGIKELAEEQTQLAALRRLYDNARVAMSHDVETIRRSLTPGQPCPVCGSKQHPYAEEAALPDYYNRKLETIDQRTAQIADTLKAYHKLNDLWQQRDNDLKKQRTAIDATYRAIEATRMLMQQTAAAKAQSDTAAEAENAERQRCEAAQKAMEAMQAERLALLKGKTADDAEATVQRYEAMYARQLEEARQTLEQQTARLSGLQGEIKQLIAAIAELEQQPVEAPEQLPETIARSEKELREIEQQLATAAARLMQEERNRQKLKQIEAELPARQATAEQWEKLNKLIGSADGKKFKIIAQSYTLDLLLLHANKHLAYLSTRYKLQQVPDTLALQVVDGDMCDEVRTVYSLSGGESFLISLALALGLSSLSSNNLKVESLFIDEGFGSLDADSLRVAMEALEQLRMQGRKVGVISHVQEMSERIAVQIVVQKGANGKSSIRVVG